jgi:dihydrofolate reductase
LSTSILPARKVKQRRRSTEANGRGNPFYFKRRAFVIKGASIFLSRQSFKNGDDAAMHVSLMVAITVDGKIARASNHYPDWTGKADKQLYVQITRKAGVMIMGSTTFDIIGRVLPGRKTIVMTRNPDRRSDREDLVFTQAPPDEILNDLASQGYEEAVVVGGAKVNQVFAENGLIDELILTLSPHAFGTGLSIFSGAVDLKLSLKKFWQLDENTLCLRYRVNR